MNDVFIMSANRSAIGGFGGSLKSFCPVDLGTLVAKEAIKRSGYDPKEIEHAVFGNVIHTEPRANNCIALIIACNPDPHNL